MKAGFNELFCFLANKSTFRSDSKNNVLSLVNGAGWIISQVSKQTLVALDDSRRFVLYKRFKMLMKINLGQNRIACLFKAKN